MTDLDPATPPAPKRSGPLGWVTRIPTPIIFVICIGVALAVVWKQGKLGHTWDVIRDADLAPMLLAAPIYVASLWLLCIRWHQLVRMAQGWSDLPRAAEAFLTSVVINYAAPVGLAVPSRAALTKRALGLDAEATGVIALWEILCDVAVLGVGTIAWLLLAHGSTTAVWHELAQSRDQYLWVGVIVLIILAVGLAWVLPKKTWRQKFFKYFKRIIVAPSQRPKDAALALITTALYWAIQGVVLALLIDALHVHPDPVLVLGLVSLPMLVGMLSPIPGGAVVREALMYVVARLADVPGGQVVTAAVVYRMALFAAIPLLYAITRIWIARRGPSHHNLPQSTTDTRASVPGS